MTEKVSKYDSATLLLIQTLKSAGPGPADLREVVAADILIEEINRKTGLHPKQIISDILDINKEMGYDDELSALTDLAEDLLGVNLQKKIKHIVNGYFSRRNLSK